MTSEPAVIALAVQDPLSDPKLARELGCRYLLWDAHVWGKRRVDLHPLVLPAPLHEAAVRAAEEGAAIITAAARRAFDDPAEQARYRLASDTHALAVASHTVGDDEALMRVDLLLAEDGSFRMCELNADCPGGHNEATALPHLARLAGFNEASNPTRVLDALADRLALLARRPGQRAGAVGLLYATGYSEDLQVCALIKHAVERRGIKALLLPPTAPRLRDGKLMAAGTELSVLYRFFPLEGMAGQGNVPELEQAVRLGVVRTMSSFSHIYAQSKLAMARAWALRTQLDAAHERAVNQHLPMTFDVRDLPSASLLADRSGWVLKRAFGRVGDDVFVGALFDDEAWADIVAGVVELDANGEVWVAQRFIPQRAIDTPWGPQLLTLGAYVLNGAFQGYFARLSQVSHVSHDALCVPVFTRGEA